MFWPSTFSCAQIFLLIPWISLWHYTLSTAGYFTSSQFYVEKHFSEIIPQFLEGSWLQIGKPLTIFTSERLCFSEIFILYPAMLPAISCQMFLRLFLLFCANYFYSLSLPLSASLGCVAAMKLKMCSRFIKWFQHLICLNSTGKNIWVYEMANHLIVHCVTTFLE